MRQEIDEATVSRNEINAAETISTIGFTADIGIRMLHLEPGICECILNIEPRHLNSLDIVHGGVLFSLADTASSLAAASYGGGGTTVQGSIDYLRAVKGSYIRCTAKVIKNGSHLIWTEADLTDENGRLCCKGSFIHYQLEGAVNFGIHSVFKDSNDEKSGETR